MSLSPSERTELVTMYAAGPDVIDRALSGITPAGWDATEAPGEWSPRQVVHHLADSETTSAIRLRRVLVEDDPLIQGYDQDAFAHVLHYDRDPTLSLHLFRAVRASTAELIERLTESDWHRSGTHSDTGPYTLDDWLRIYGVHAHEHADQIRRARAAVGS